MVSLAEAQRRLASGRNDRPCVSITFDDGYADNCDQALPLLIRERIPCTYFVTTRNVIDGKPFPHDVAVRPAARSRTRPTRSWRWPTPASNRLPHAAPCRTWAG